MIRKAILTVAVLFLVSAPAWALLGAGFGVRGGLVSNYQIGGAPAGVPVPKKLTMIGVHSAFSRIPAFVIEGSLEYNWKQEAYNDPTYGSYKLRINDFSANAFAKVRFPMSTVKPYLGGGLGLHKLVYSISNASGTVPIPDDATKPAYHAMLGLAVSPPMMPFELFGEYRWTWISTPDKTTKFPTLLAGMTIKM